jgi:hypothetical protein
MNNAFRELGRRAATNDEALQLLIEGTRYDSLRGAAVSGLGIAAVDRPEALELLLHPEENGFRLSGAVGALGDAARNGNERAINFMYDVSTKPENKPLWRMAANALGPSAADGNEQAIAGLANMIGEPNPSIRTVVRGRLSEAAAHGSATAANALREMDRSNVEAR